MRHSPVTNSLQKVMMKQIERHVFIAALAMVLKAIKRPCDADWFSGLGRMKIQLRHMTW